MNETDSIRASAQLVRATLHGAVDRRIRRARRTRLFALIAVAGSLLAMTAAAAPAGLNVFDRDDPNEQVAATREASPAPPSDAAINLLRESLRANSLGSIGDPIVLMANGDLELVVQRASKKHLCVVALIEQGGGNATCGSTTFSVQNPIKLGALSDPRNSEIVVFGIAADGVRSLRITDSTGRMHVVPVKRNAFSWSGSSTTGWPTDVRATFTDGTTVGIPSIPPRPGPMAVS